MYTNIYYFPIESQDGLALFFFSRYIGRELVFSAVQSLIIFRAI